MTYEQLINLAAQKLGAFGGLADGIARELLTPALEIIERLVEENGNLQKRINELEKQMVSKNNG